MGNFIWFSNLSKKKLYYWLIAAIVLICAGCAFLLQGKTQAKAVKEEVFLVRAAQVTAADKGQKYIYSGEVRGRYESQLAFQVGGKVIKRNVELGSSVQAYDILMQLDPRDLQQTVNNNSAYVSSA